VGESHECCHFARAGRACVFVFFFAGFLVRRAGWIGDAADALHGSNMPYRIPYYLPCSVEGFTGI